MLVLGVNAGDYVMIGDDIKIRVLKTGSIFRIAVDAPKDQLILRKSLYELSNPDVDDSEFETIQALKAMEKRIKKMKV